jgi:hypothetical protein
MIPALNASSATSITIAVSQSNLLSNLIHKVAMSALYYLAASLYIPSSWTPIAVCFLVGLTVALTLFTSIERHQYDPCSEHCRRPILYNAPVYRPIIHSPIEICRPPVSYPIYRQPIPPVSFRQPLPSTSFQPRMDRVGGRLPVR